MSSGEIAGFSVADARMILEVARYLRANGFVVPQPSRGQQFIPPAASIYVRNDSGVVVPPFACMQTTGTVEDGGQNYITIDQPVDTTATAGAYLFNGLQEIEVGGKGIAHDGPLCRVLTDGTALSSGDKCQPAVGEWYIELGGDLITVVGDDDIETDVVRGVIGNAKIFQFIRFELNEELVGTSASAEIYDKDGALIASAATLEDPETIFTGLTATTRGIGVQDGSRFFIVNANCPAEETP